MQKHFPATYTTFVQPRPNVLDVGPTLYKCYTKCFVFARFTFKLFSYQSVFYIIGLCLGQVLYVSLLTPQLYFDKNRALAGGLINLSFIFSLISGPITERLTQHFAWRGTMLLWGGILLNQVSLPHTTLKYVCINMINHEEGFFQFEINIKNVVVS